MKFMGTESELDLDESIKCQKRNRITRGWMDGLGRISIAGPL